MGLRCIIISWWWGPKILTILTSLNFFKKHLWSFRACHVHSKLLDSTDLAQQHKISNVVRLWQQNTSKLTQCDVIDMSCISFFYNTFKIWIWVIPTKFLKLKPSYHRIFLWIPVVPFQLRCMPWVEFTLRTVNDAWHMDWRISRLHTSVRTNFYGCGNICASGCWKTFRYVCAS